MDPDGDDGDVHLDLFGDSNLDSDLRNLFSPSSSPNLPPSDLAEDGFEIPENQNPLPQPAIATTTKTVHGSMAAMNSALSGNAGAGLVGKAAVGGPAGGAALHSAAARAVPTTVTNAKGPKMPVYTKTQGHAPASQMQQVPQQQNPNMLSTDSKAVTSYDIRKRFSMQMSDAAASLRVTLPTFKKACHQHGITKWPQRRLNAIETRLTKIREDMKKVPLSAQTRLKAEAATLTTERQNIFDGKLDSLPPDGYSLIDLSDVAGETQVLPQKGNQARSMEGVSVKSEDSRNLSSELAEHGAADRPPAATKPGTAQARGPAPPAKKQGAAEGYRGELRGGGGRNPDVHPPWQEFEESGWGAAGASAGGHGQGGADDVGIVAPEEILEQADRPRIRRQGASQDVQAQIERLEEENSSLRAISKYLMQERKELVKKAEIASKRNQNLMSLMKVMRWKLGCNEQDVEHDEMGHGQPAGSSMQDANIFLGEEIGVDVGDRGLTNLEFNADGMLAEVSDGGIRDHVNGPDHDARLQGSDIWFSGGAGDHPDELLSDLI